MPKPKRKPRVALDKILSEAQKNRVRRNNNRQAAQNLRDRKRRYEVELEEKASALESENKDMESRIAEATATTADLQNKLRILSAVVDKMMELETANAAAAVPAGANSGSATTSPATSAAAMDTTGHACAATATNTISPEHVELIPGFGSDCGAPSPVPEVTGHGGGGGGGGNGSSGSSSPYDDTMLTLADLDPLLALPDHGPGLGLDGLDDAYSGDGLSADSKMAALFPTSLAMDGGAGAGALFGDPSDALWSDAPLDPNHGMVMPDEEPLVAPGVSEALFDSAAIKPSPQQPELQFCQALCCFLGLTTFLGPSSACSSENASAGKAPALDATAPTTPPAASHPLSLPGHGPLPPPGTCATADRPLPRPPDPSLEAQAACARFVASVVPSLPLPTAPPPALACRGLVTAG